MSLPSQKMCWDSYWIQDFTWFTMFSFDGAGQCKDQSIGLVVWRLIGVVRVTRGLFPPDSWRQNGCVSTPVIWLRAERRWVEGRVGRSFTVEEQSCGCNWQPATFAFHLRVCKCLSPCWYLCVCVCAGYICNGNYRDRTKP